MKIITDEKYVLKNEKLGKSINMPMYVTVKNVWTDLPSKTKMVCAVAGTDTHWMTCSRFNKYYEVE